MQPAVLYHYTIFPLIKPQNGVCSLAGLPMALGLATHFATTRHTLRAFIAEGRRSGAAARPASQGSQPAAALIAATKTTTLSCERSGARTAKQAITTCQCDCSAPAALLMPPVVLVVRATAARIRAASTWRGRSDAQLAGQHLNDYPS